MATKKKINKTNLILLGLATAAVGTWILAGDKIKNLFKPQPVDDILDQTQLTIQTPTPTGGGGGGGGTKPKQIEPSGPDLDKKLFKGAKGDEVKRLQVIINEIEAMRGRKTLGKVKFPLTVDGDLGPSTFAAALDCFPSLKSNGYVTLHEARLKWAYSLGYYNKPFSGSLVNSARVVQYQAQYKLGAKDGPK
jgi:hypothetical protein